LAIDVHIHIIGIAEKGAVGRLSAKPLGNAKPLAADLSGGVPTVRSAVENPLH
jgi:hypothetical protein